MHTFEEMMVYQYRTMAEALRDPDAIIIDTTWVDQVKEAIISPASVPGNLQKAAATEMISSRAPRRYSPPNSSSQSVPPDAEAGSEHASTSNREQLKGLSTCCTV